ncbi:MAG: dethiobiotin synthase [Acidobacteriota bacterium]
MAVKEPTRAARGLVITGTDTEIGKTVVSAMVAARYRNEVDLAYWKPVASGSEEDRDVDTVAHLSGAEVLPEEYLLSAPLSPHLAARLEERWVDPERILERYRGLVAERPERALVIEGVGGLMVPLNDDGYLLIELLTRLALPCLVVARSSLGTINHTLLTLEALRRRGLEVAGVVLDGPPNPENRAAIRNFGDVEIIGQVLPMDPLDPQAVATWARAFDLPGRLRRYLAG